MTMPEGAMPAWISLLMSSLVGVLAAGISVGLMRGNLSQITAGQDRLQKSIDELSQVTNGLSIKVTVSQSQHDELSRRLVNLEAKVGVHDEVLNVLRARSHNLAGAMQRIDPSWHPYAEP